MSTLPIIAILAVVATVCVISVFNRSDSYVVKWTDASGFAFESPRPQAGPAEQNSAPLLTAKGISMRFPGTRGGFVQVLKNANIELRPGLTALIGPSGTGKSTLLHILAGMLRPDAGEVHFDGTRLSFCDEGRLREHRARIAIVFQDGNLISHLTACENVALPLLLRRHSRGEAMAQARELLSQLKLDDRADHRPDQLSRGQQQRVALARSFAAGSPVILADEPTASLDPATALEVMEGLRIMADSSRCAVLVATHNHSLAREFCQRILEYRDGAFVTVPAGAFVTVPNASSPSLADSEPSPPSPPSPSSPSSSLSSPSSPPPSLLPSSSSPSSPLLSSSSSPSPSPAPSLSHRENRHVRQST